MGCAAVRQSEFNADCDMLRRDLFWTSNGGFPIRRDSLRFCTSLLYDVLNVIFKDMAEDGFIADRCLGPPYCLAEV
eukprot:809514-Rhodomonas_salina.2